MLHDKRHGMRLPCISSHSWHAFYRHFSPFVIGLFVHYLLPSLPILCIHIHDYLTTPPPPTLPPPPPSLWAPFSQHFYTHTHTACSCMLCLSAPVPSSSLHEKGQEGKEGRDPTTAHGTGQVSICLSTSSSAMHGEQMVTVMNSDSVCVVWCDSDSGWQAGGGWCYVCV